MCPRRSCRASRSPTSMAATTGLERPNISLICDSGRHDDVHGLLSLVNMEVFSMPAYMIAEHIITDAARFDEYRAKAAPMIARYGGRYLTKGGSHKLPEGGHWKPE